MSTNLRALITGSLCLLSPLAPARVPAPQEVDAFVERTIYYDFLGDDGNLTGGTMRDRLPARPDLGPVTPAPWTTVHSAASGAQGPPLPGSVPANRVDLVFVGDGYKALQLDAYAARVDAMVAGMFALEPYKTYAGYYNVHRVDVVSNQSGVDHAPTFGILKDTAMDMQYWFMGVERALWVDSTKAWSFANNAPDVDFVVAVARNMLYGGLSLTGTDVVTVSGGNAFAPELLEHELGHAQGGLADEYFTAGTTYDDIFEFGQPNISILTESEMLATDTKWARWIGVDDPMWDGLVSTYEGAHYTQFGIFRPTWNSVMRNIGRPFNPPSAEAMVIEIYRRVNPIADSSDPNVFYPETATLWIDPMQPVGHELEIQWSLDGTPIPGATDATLALCGVTIPAGWHAVGVEVVDPTSLVRNEAARDQWLTQNLFFVVNSAGGAGAGTYCTAAPNSTGSGANLTPLGTTSLAADDFGLRVSGVPALQPGLFFTGTGETSAPFGDGFLCVSGNTVRFEPQVVASDGSAELLVPWTALPGGLQVHAGDARTFQFWYRDPAASGAGFNLSDAVAATLCP